jgi:hypothetical protein
MIEDSNPATAWTRGKKVKIEVGNVEKEIQSNSKISFNVWTKLRTLFKVCKNLVVVVQFARSTRLLIL